MTSVSPSGDMDISYFYYVIPKEHGVVEQEFSLELFTDNNRPFFIDNIPVGTRYGDIITWKASSDQTIIQTFIIKKGQ